jgi:hypothetical protein
MDDDDELKDVSTGSSMAIGASQMGRINVRMNKSSM